MWKRRKAGKTPSSNGTLDRTPTSSPGLEEGPNLASPEPPPNLPVSERNLLSADRTLQAATDMTPSTPPQSRFSTIRSLLSSSGQQRHQLRDRRNDPYGLLVLHTPPNRTLDIVFIHGLGGSSLQTWCFDRNLKNLWPKLWLPAELPTARVLTFGYDSHFSSRKKQVSGGIGDFATDLLFRLKYSENTTERLGEVPIVIVTHSMGGLVFKKAFVQGHLNPEYSEIISMIKAVLFLATPHRGTDLATLLHRLLSTSILGHSPKKYVTELARKSPTIDELNESFRHISSKLQIFSFYETLATVIGPTSVTIVDKATAVMGYPEEIQIPLVANHHDVCKFSNAKDANYISVIGALRSIANSIASGLIASTSNLSAPAPVEKSQYLTDLLRVAGPPEEDISVMYSARKQGLCDTLWATEEMSRWLSSETPQILWIHAPPGSGKSTLCSLVVNRLLETGHRCCYFFFKYGQRDKRSANAMLRSIAYQTALHVPEFRRALVDIAKSGVKLQTADPAAIWDKLFSTKLDKAGMEDNIYWVLDGLDEADSSKRVVELMSRVKDIGSCVRILIFGRPLPNITQEFQVAKKRIEVQNLPLPNNQNDIHSMVAEKIDHLLSNDSFKAEIVNEVVTRSQGNFLWASLVAQNLAKFRREDQIRRLLDFTPDGMHELYDRMTDTILDLPLAEDKALARVLLIWAMYAINPPTVEELTEAYPVEFEGVLDLNHTVTYVCGQFVVVNSQRQVSLVHHSAREYLEKAERRPYALDAQHAHEECFRRCITTLCDSSLKRKLRMLQPPQFLPYAATSWPSHLRGCSSDSEQALDILVRFLSGPQPLAWIQYLAMSNGLSELLSASRELTAYTRRRKTANRHKPPGKRRLSDLSLIASWATDLMKVPSKFGFYLTEKPSMVYQCLPALCPTSSIMHQKFNQNPASTLAVSGLSSYTQWDDRLARVSGGPGQAHHLARSVLYLAMANNDPIGTVTVWDTTLFDELKVFSIGEYVAALAFNNSGSLLACYSSSKTFVWDVTDWSLQMSAENPRLDHILEFRFDEDDTLMMVTEFRRLHKLVAGETQALPAWEKQDPALLGEPLARPCCVTFNGNCTQIAISYSHFPVSIWSVEPPEMVARLKNSPSHERRPMVSYTGKSKVVWHPSGVHVICIYGKAFKWNFDTDLYQEVEDKNETPHDLACSPDGRTFITMNAKGLIQIYDFSSMALIYNLSTEGMSNRLCFSLDGLQIYHLTRSYCNIWEPKCLLTLADEASGQVQSGDADAGNFLCETDDDPNTPISIAAPETPGNMEGRPDILDVAPGPAYKGLLVGYTNRDGSVNIYDAISNRKYEIRKIDFAIKIDRLAWSPKYDRLAYSMINGGTAVVAISTSVGPRGVRSVSTEAVYTDKDWNTDRGRTHRIVFHSTDSRLLISGRDRCQVLALPQGDVLGEIQHPNHFDCLEWQRHPSEPEHLLRFTSSSITIFSWGDLEEKASIPIDLTNPTPGTDGDQPPVELDAILDNYCRQYLLLRTFTMVRNSPRYSFAILPSKEVYSRTAAHLIPESAVQPESPTQFKPVNLPPSIKPILIPESLTSIVTHPLGILRDGLLVFLDRQLWLCTTTLPYPTAPTDGPGSAEKDKQEFKPDVKRYFFIPQDWVTEEGLRMCRVLEDGTVLCPSKGEVAILKGGLVEDSWV